MSLIINESALSDFSEESVDSSTIMYCFNSLISMLGSEQSLQALTFDQTDPSMPTWLSEACQTEWTAAYQDSLFATNTSNIDKLNIQSYSMISTLFYIATSAPLSRQDVVDQLTSTLSGYSNTAVNSFFASIQLS